MSISPSLGIIRQSRFSPSMLAPVVDRRKSSLRISGWKSSKLHTLGDSGAPTVRIARLTNLVSHINDWIVNSTSINQITILTNETNDNKTFALSLVRPPSLKGYGPCLAF